MNKLVPWLKANWLPLSALLIALIAAPVALYFASSWRSSIREAAVANVNKDIAALNAIDVTYEVQPFLSGLEPVSVKTAPNDASTQAVARILDQVNSESAAVLQAAIEFNSRGKAPIINGPGPSETLFPQPESESSRLRLLSRMVAEWPRAHVELLRRQHMGMPLSADQVVAILQQREKVEISRLDSNQPGRTLTPDEKTEITKILSELRLQLYRNEARRITAYAEPRAFTGVVSWPATGVLPLETAWEWQTTYWVHEEIIRAIANANADTVGGWLPVYEAPVKRVFAMSISGPSASAAAGGAERGSSGAAPAEPQPPGDEKAELPRDFSLSHTGRSSWPATPNPIYDIRFVDVSLLVSSERLPAVLAAFPRTNFMTVVGLEVADYDPKADLREGFDYGADHLVRANLRIETVWLRGWMKQWMPANVRTALGIPADVPPEAPADDASEQPLDDTE